MENSNSEFPPLPTALGNPADRAGFPHSHSADGGFYIDTTFKLLPKFQNQEIIIAREVKMEGKTLTLRNAQGVPEWAGKGRMRMNNPQ